MKKAVVILIGLLALVGCFGPSIDYISGAIKVENRVKIYIDNLSSQDVVPVIELGRNFITFGGIGIAKNTTGSFIEIDFSKDITAQNGERYNVDLLVTTSDSAINKFGVTSYNKYKDGIYMADPRPRIILKDSLSTESAFEITRESY